MLTLINTNRMRPPVAPIGLDYVGGAAREAGYDVELLDLGLAEDPDAELAKHFDRHSPELIGVSVRNVDDCFWPSGQSFLPTLESDLAAVRRRTDAPIVLGGIGYSIFPREMLVHTGADFGICGDGEAAVTALLSELRGKQRWEWVPGLVYRRGGELRANAPAWPQRPSAPPHRDLADNAAYFRLGGQLGVETKRGCGRRCIYCPDPAAKGGSNRLRSPAETAAEISALLAQGVDVLHWCDPEFNLPPKHAQAVCDELIRRDLGGRVRWYAYLAVLPFPPDLARAMRRAGCVGVNFTSDSAHPGMLAAYGHRHRKADLARAVRLCRDHGMAVMLDLLLGGPGETPETIAHTITAVQAINPDCAGAALGVRVFPGTPMAAIAAAEGPMEANPNIRRNYEGPVDLLRPTFYISSALGERPDRLVRDLIGGDQRFFAPQEAGSADCAAAAGDHNYNENRRLIEAIEAGERGAYWDILRRLRRP